MNTERRGLTAIEFFSGIGAFAAACRGLPIAVVAAFDQDQRARDVYALNHGLTPRGRNLDTITDPEIPPADLWWLSPPCKPYTLRGSRKDEDDPRAASLLNLIQRISQGRPPVVILENVFGFRSSRARERLMEALLAGSYRVRAVDLCSTDLGTPMRRPRHFILAARTGVDLEGMPLEPARDPVPLRAYLDPDPDPALTLDEAVVARAGHGFHRVDGSDPGAVLSCITSGYGRCLDRSGSILTLPTGSARYLSPGEIARLMGLPGDFRFPAASSRRDRYRLLGNSVDVRVVRHLLHGLLRLSLPVS